jgi:hypothetical protein
MHKLTRPPQPGSSEAEEAASREAEEQASVSEGVQTLLRERSAITGGREWGTPAMGVSGARRQAEGAELPMRRHRSQAVQSLDSRQKEGKCLDGGAGYTAPPRAALASRQTRERLHSQ